MGRASKQGGFLFIGLLPLAIGFLVIVFLIRAF